MFKSKLTRQVSFIALTLLAAIGTVAAAERNLLWSVVQICVTNHELTGASFPCLKVETGGGIKRGFVTIRAPLERTHVIVSPTARLSGIEDPSLQSTAAPHFFQNAWDARKFVFQAAEPLLEDADIGLALNSRPGRSQDQLHIHVDCLSHPVAQEVRMHDSEIQENKWSHLTFPLRGRYYWATLLRPADLAEKNVFETASTLLPLSPGRLEDTTLVVIPRSEGGFYLLSDQFLPGTFAKGHGEFLLDHSCSRS
jgi:CDP-diacylglycerol pyrophosphatase